MLGLGKQGKGPHERSTIVFVWHSRQRGTGYRKLVEQSQGYPFSLFDMLEPGDAVS